jgi:UDP-N-acetylglucosamine 1-carboxyvinyltransferase
VAPQQFIKEAPYGILSSQVERYQIEGRQKLEGSVVVQGAKNAALPIIAASLLASRGQTILHNVPLIRDVFAALELAKSLGAKVTLHEEDQVVVIDASSMNTGDLAPELTSLFRASVLFLAPILQRMGSVTLESVGGCSLGRRGLDFHYRGFVRLGAEISEEGQSMALRRERDLVGTYLYLDTPSHTGTENLMVAAALAKGTTTIENAAVEPEIADVANFLNKMGARISGIGTGVLHIEGVNELVGVEYTIMPDRIDAGTLAMFAAATQGDIALIGVQLAHFGVARAKLEQMGVEFLQDGPVIRVRRPGALRPINVTTWPYPGFATDLQPQIMALACAATGKSYIRETIFNQRFAVAQELQKMGADIELDGEAAVIAAPTSLSGVVVQACDLRAGLALMLAGAIAEGETTIENASMIERGCSAVIRRFSQLGLTIAEERKQVSTR